MKIAIIGAGAMGSIYGGLLQAAGDEVWLVDVRRDHIEAVRANGLRVAGASGDRTVRVAATLDPAEPGVAELVILSTKMRDLSAAAQAARPLIGPDTAVLAIQNGLGNVDRVAPVLGTKNLLIGIAGGFGASFVAPGHVHHNGWEMVHIAEVGGGLTPRLARIVKVWQDAGFRAAGYADPDSLVWEKFVCNIAFSATCAVTGLRIGQVLDNPQARSVAEACAREAFAVARAKGIKLGFDDPVARIDAFGRAIPNARPSMLLDVLAGRPSEIDALNEALVEEGERAGVPTPANRMMAALVRAIERKIADFGQAYGAV
ncbi:MAG: ketopantoate reductase family protein [Pseudomonadota bacterium]